MIQTSYASYIEFKQKVLVLNFRMLALPKQQHKHEGFSHSDVRLIARQFCCYQRELFLSEVNNRGTIAAVEENNDTYCLQI